LRQWATDHNVNFPVVIDGQGAQLAAYFPVGSVPVNIVVNPRTMEVLAVDVGEVTDIQSYEQGFLAGL
jgi:DNA-binding beta-propeller fold protein YncE